MANSYDKKAQHIKANKACEAKVEKGTSKCTAYGEYWKYNTFMTKRLNTTQCLLWNIFVMWWMFFFIHEKSLISVSWPFVHFFLLIFFSIFKNVLSFSSFLFPKQMLYIFIFKYTNYFGRRIRETFTTIKKQLKLINSLLSKICWFY